MKKYLLNVATNIYEQGDAYPHSYDKTLCVCDTRERAEEVIALIYKSFPDANPVKVSNSEVRIWSGTKTFSVEEIEETPNVQEMLSLVSDDIAKH